MKQKSPSGSIDWIGLKKVGKGALIVGGATALTYILEALPGVHLGAYTPMVVGILSIGINYLRKWIISYK
ncbi:hypothetical protein ES703_97066 [subsurface metagenome]